jgi:hypothetical protein
MKKLSELIIGDSVEVRTNMINISGNTNSFDRIVKSINKHTITMHTNEEFCIITGENILNSDNMFGLKIYILFEKNPKETEFFFNSISDIQFERILEMEHNSFSINHSKKILFFNSENELEMFKFLLELNSEN